MEEIMQKFVGFIRSWLKKAITAFKDGRYIWCCLVAIAPFAGLWAGAKLFWLIIDLICLFLKQHGEQLLVFLGGPILFVFGFWWLFVRKAEHEPQVVSTPENEVIMKHAKQGRNALLDNIFMVGESLAEQTEIYSPGTIGELAYPSLNRCIHLEDDVPVVTVQFRYEGEIDPAKFLERFNNRMAQKLDSGELSGKPPVLFYDKDNNPHTAIQAIRCVPLKGKKYIRLDVVRVNEAALALMDEVERGGLSEADNEEQLTDDEL